MPYKANEPRRHKIPKARYKIENWAEYDAALRRRGSLTVWVTPEAIAAVLINWSLIIGFGYAEWKAISLLLL